MDAYDFSTNLADSEICFGVDITKTASILREIADKLDSKKYLLKSVRVMTQAHNEEFPVTILRITLFEKRLKHLLAEVEKKLDGDSTIKTKLLYAAGSQFPYATRKI